MCIRDREWGAIQGAKIARKIRRPSWRIDHGDADTVVPIKLSEAMATSLENQKAIKSLLLIIDSDSDNKEMLSEAYYLLGRTNFIENNIIDSVKYFGIRHRDFSEIDRFKAENYFWLGRSLFGIGDQENGCLIMEDIIFSSEYLNNTEVVEDSKALQTEQECGLIIN